MFKRIKKILFFFLCSYCSYNCIGQDLSFIKLSSEQGFPSNEIYSLLKDRKGYIWGATDGGIFRYNGEEVKVFTTKNGLPDNTILNIYEDLNGKIWASSFNGRIAYIYNDKVTLISANDSLSELVKASAIISLQVSADGTLWVGTLHHLLKIPSKNNYSKILKYNSPRGILIKEIEKGKLIISIQDFDSNPSPKGLPYVLERFRSSDTIFPGSYKKLTVLKCKLLKNNTILFNQDTCLLVIEKSNKIKNINFRSTITSIYETEEGVWVGTMKNGVYLYENGEMNSIPKNYLKGYTISSIARDYENGMWFGTIGAGLLYCPLPKMLSYASYSGLDEKIIALKNYKNETYVLNESNTLYKINKNYSCQILHKFARPFISEQAQIEINKKEIAFSGFYSGKIDHNQNLFVPFTRSDKKTVLASKGIISIDNSKYLLLGYYYLLLVENNKLKKNYNFQLKTRSIAKDEKGNIFFSTLSNLYQFKDEKLILIQDPQKFLNIRINHILPVKNYLVLATSGNGLLIYNQLSKKIIQINKEKGLIDDICTFAQVNKNEIWVGTKKGISQVVFTNKDFRTFNISNFDVSSGLISNEIYNIDFKNNELWIGTRKGLFVITDYRSIENKTLPIIYLENIEINKKTYKFHSDTIIKLIYSENNITIHLSNLSYRNSNQARYYLKLEGYDKDYKTTSGSIIEYQNLPPGNYSFKAYALNNNGIKSKTPITINFYISFPYWKTWWFTALEIITCLMAISLIIQVRIRNLRKKEKKKTEINNKILEHQISALRAQMNPHFIFNAINGIQRYVVQNKTEEAYNYLTNFSKLIRIVLENANEKYITLNNEIETLNLYVELELLRFENKFQYKINIDKNIDPENILIPGMLIQPFAENAIWHGIMPLNKVTEAFLKINIFKREENLVIQIADNGIGRKKSQEMKQLEANKPLGISISLKRLKLIDNKSTILITDLYNKNQESAGTLVEIVTCIKHKYL